MNKKNVVLLIDSMFSGCNSKQKEKLAVLYKEAYSSTDEFIKLSKILNEYDFYGSLGQDLFNSGKEAITEGLTQAGNFTKNLSIIEYVLSNTSKYKLETDNYLNTFSCYSKDLYLIKKDDASYLKVFLMDLMNLFCYSISILYGVQYLKDVKIDINANAIDMLRNFTSEISGVISEISETQKPFAWRVVRKTFSGANLVRYNGFCVEKINNSDFINDKRNVKLSPYLYIPKNDDNVLCYGIGNVSNINERNGISVVGTTIISKFPQNALDNENIDYQNINVLNLINDISNSGVGIITPYEFTDMLNRYFLMQTVKERNTKQVCVYCGKISCNHFRIPENFSINAN